MPGAVNRETSRISEVPEPIKWTIAAGARLTFVGHRGIVRLQVLGGHFDASREVLDGLHGGVHADVQTI